MNNKIIILFFLVISGCTQQKKFSTTDFSSQYRNLTIQPKFRVYITGNDSAALLFEINRDGLLYKKNENGHFESSFSIQIANYTDSKNSTTTDTSSLIIKNFYDSINNSFRGSIRFKVCQCVNYLKINLNDIYRGQEYIYGLTIDSRNQGSSYYYNITDNFGQDLMSTVLEKDMSVNIFPPNDIDKLTVRYYNRNYPLAQPPFSNNPPEIFDLHSDSVFTISAAGLEGLTFHNKGLYLFQNDTLNSNGFSVFCADDDYPSFTTADQLIDALRYLTTKKEYEKLINSKDKRKSVDEFWLEKAGNNERGRKLIKIYYGRAKDANVHFTSFMEGWRTDRGMIYIVFGPPTTVYRTNNSEVWDYRLVEGMPITQFIFNRMNNPFTDNDYILERGLELQNAWYIAVDNWRVGRIAGDY